MRTTLEQSVDRFILLFNEEWATGFIKYNKENKNNIAEVVCELGKRAQEETNEEQKEKINYMISKIKDAYEMEFIGHLLK